MKRILIYTIVLGVAMVSCKGNESEKESIQEVQPQVINDDHNAANEHMHSTDFETLVKNFESKERDAYQEPDKVLRYLGDLKGKTIIDIGAGTGYFSFRFVEKGANVIAADVNDQFQEYIEEKRDSLKISPEKLKLRMVKYDDPLLEENEVDMVVIVNTYHHIEDRVDYFSRLKRGIKPGGELVVIDFVKKEIPMGPPVKMKMSPEEVSSELAQAGFTSFDVNDSLLKYQYILRAK